MNRKLVKQFSVACCLISIFVFLPGCGSSRSSSSTPVSSAASQPEFLYVSGQNQIASFSINTSDGSLTALPATPGPNNAMVLTKMMAASPDAKFFYDYDLANNAVIGFSIDPAHGTLTPINGSPFSIGPPPAFPAIAGGLLTDPTGKFLFLANVFNLAVFNRDNQSGALTSIAGSPFQDSDGPFEMVSDAIGKFLYSNNLGFSSINVSGFVIDSNSGVLTALPDSPFPVSLQEDPFGTHLLISKQFLFRISLQDSEVEAWRIDQTTGDLSAVPGSPFPTDIAPAGMATDMEGKFLYIANLGGGNVSAYGIDPATGTLTALPGSPFSLGVPAAALAVDGTGQFLYVTSSRATILGLKIDAATGTLTALNQGPVIVSSPLPLAPQMIVVKP